MWECRWKCNDCRRGLHQSAPLTLLELESAWCDTVDGVVAWRRSAGCRVSLNCFSNAADKYNYAQQRANSTK